LLKTNLKTAAAGAITGIVNGLFGAGGGMILIPLLTRFTDLSDAEIFPASISIILPMCIISLFVSSISQPLPWSTALPYLIGSALGGVLAGKFGKNIPTVWLHRGLGLLILYGGLRYLC
jgi:uncharacterized membrane protein YfcA